jgi:hypothetical protein
MGFFGLQAYEIFMNKDAWASGFYSRYGDFGEWWNKEIGIVDMPEQRLLSPYKRHVATLFGYIYVAGIAFTVIGEQFGPVVLFVGHFFNMLVANAPAKIKFEVDREKGFTMSRHNYMIDQALCFILLMIAFSELSWNSKKAEDSLVKGKKTKEMAWGSKDGGKDLACGDGGCC